MKGRVLVPVLALLAAGGCARYTPAPRYIAATALAPVPPALDAVAAEATRLRPGVPFDVLHWDRVTLLAAALVGNRDIAAARSAIVTAQAAARAARAGNGPTLTLSSEYAGAATEASPWLFGAALDIPLDIGKRRRSRLDSASLAVETARYDLADTSGRRARRSGVRSPRI